MPPFEAPALPVPLIVREDPRARRLSLAVCPARRHVRLTVPRRTPPAAVQRFLVAQADWLEAAIARALPPALPFAPGLILPVADRAVLLAPGPGRVARAEEGRLLVPGNAALFAARTRRWLIARAALTLEAETRELAARHGLRAPMVRVGDPASRWGSCAASGRIAYSWRLLLAPGFVRESVVAHEVAHLAEPNHGPGFWTLAERLLGGSHAPARAWLKAHGPALLAYGAEDGAGGGAPGGRIAAPGEG
jgi:predicted metal-dependent hydrolase